MTAHNLFALDAAQGQVNRWRTAFPILTARINPARFLSIRSSDIGSMKVHNKADIDLSTPIQTATVRP